MTTADTYARQNDVYRQIARVIDPELGVSIVKLGLIYDILVEDGDVTIVMTLTTQGCPMERAITSGVHRVAEALPWVTSVTVRLVWDPPWHPGMMR